MQITLLSTSYKRHVSTEIAVNSNSNSKHVRSGKAVLHVGYTDSHEYTLELDIDAAKNIILALQASVDALRKQGY